MKERLASFTRYAWENPNTAQVAVAAIYLSFADATDPAYAAAQRFIERADSEYLEIIRQVGSALPWEDGDSPCPVHGEEEGTPEKLYWHCLHCGAHYPMESAPNTGVEWGRWENCAECGLLSAHQVTLKMGACYEQGRALRLSKHAAWARSRSVAPKPTCKD